MAREPGPTREMRDKADRLRAKKEGGETLTREEAGFLGALGAIESANAERRSAERAGKLDEYEEEHRTASWMKGEETRKPELAPETRERLDEIRAKQERGETLTREEAGVLGGAAWAREPEGPAG